MPAAAILLDLLNLKCRKNRLTMDQVLISKKYDDVSKSLADWTKKDTAWQDAYDKAMHGDKAIEYQGVTYNFNSDSDARAYAYAKCGLEYDVIEYNMDFLESLDQEYDSLKTMNETQLTSLDTQIKEWQEKLAQECQETHLLGGK